MNRSRNAGPKTVDKIRHEIDSGDAGDKTEASDPAAAPLGTDAEAAGFPPSAAERDAVSRYQEGAGDGGPNSKKSHGVSALLIWGLAALLIAAVLAWALVFAG